MAHEHGKSCGATQRPYSQLIAAVVDDAERLRTAQQFVVNGTVTLAEVREIRDQTIRDLRDSGMSRREITELGVPESVVTDALRSR